MNECAAAHGMAGTAFYSQTTKKMCMDKIAASTHDEEKQRPTCQSLVRSGGVHWQRQVAGRGAAQQAGDGDL